MLGWCRRLCLSCVTLTTSFLVGHIQAVIETITYYVSRHTASIAARELVISTFHLCWNYKSIAMRKYRNSLPIYDDFPLRRSIGTLTSNYRDVEVRTLT